MYPQIDKLTAISVETILSFAFLLSIIYPFFYQFLKTNILLIEEDISNICLIVPFQKKTFQLIKITLALIYQDLYWDRE